MRNYIFICSAISALPEDVLAVLLVQKVSHECIVSGELHVLWDALNSEFLRAAYKLIELTIRNSFGFWYRKRKIAISSYHMKFA